MLSFPFSTKQIYCNNPIISSKIFYRCKEEQVSKTNTEKYFFAIQISFTAKNGMLPSANILKYNFLFTLF